MTELFGTDGVRGIANQQLTPEFCVKLARAGGQFLKDEYGQNTVFVARDTRVSGPMLEGAITAGLTSVGLNVKTLGVLPTPGVALLTKESSAVGGVMISASHNPVPDNGIKFFNQEGYKLFEREEELIEEYLEVEELLRPTGLGVGTVEVIDDAEEQYIEQLTKHNKLDLSGYKIVIDAAYGAAYEVGPRLFHKLGAEVIPINSDAKGDKINVNCGSTNPLVAGREVVDQKAHLGFSYDGDADRVIALDQEGRIVDGDKIMAILASFFHEKGMLNNSTLVTTVMSNIGLSLAMEQYGIELEKTKVGDRHVLKKMIESGYNLGGEQSGHIIYLPENTTGDGLLTSLKLMTVILTTGKSLRELQTIMTNYPQVLVNVKVNDKSQLNNNDRIDEEISKAEQLLGDTGRVLIRPSGTEPVIRVMVEGQDEEQLHKIANDISTVLKEQLGKRR